MTWQSDPRARSVISGPEQRQLPVHPIREGPTCPLCPRHLPHGSEDIHIALQSPKTHLLCKPLSQGREMLPDSCVGDHCRN